MAIKGVQVITEAGRTAGLTVEFVDDLGTIVSVRFSGRDGGINRTNAVQQAKSYLKHLVESDTIPDEMHDGDNQDGRAATIASSPNSPTKRAGVGKRK
jgi:hypothetical protein